jgi:transcriptional regulator with XRE-family HTH domain
MDSSAFAQRLKALRAAKGLTVRALADRAHCSSSRISAYEHGAEPPADLVRLLDRELGADGELIALAAARSASRPHGQVGPSDVDDEQNALELARRVSASDVGEETIARLEWKIDDLATDYPVTPPAELILRVRRHLG